MLKQMFVRVMLVVAMLLSIAPWADRVWAEGEVVNGTYVVDRSDDTIVTACTAAANDCTLRGAVQNANVSSGGDTITFAGSTDVTLTAGWIDVTGGNILIQGNGRNTTTITAASGSAAFRIASSNNTIDALAIMGGGSSGGVNQDGVWITSGTGNQVSNTAIYIMGGSGVRVAQTATNATVINNVLGTGVDANGNLGATCLYANERYGIDLNTNSNTATANTIVCNKLGGVHITNSAQSNSLRTNTIGVTTAGVRLGNQTAGVVVEDGASNNAIGGGFPSERNTISGNTGYGVLVRGDTTDNNTVANSYIGLSPTGTLAISNTLGGVSIEQQAAQNIVQYNVIAGNGGPGVQVLGTGVVGVTDTYFNKIYSNTIGLNTSNAAVPNTVGVYVFNTALFTEIGGYASGALIPNTGNIIAGNTYHGVHLYNAHSVTVAGNVIGLNVGNTAVPNQGDGVRIEGSSGQSSDIISNTLAGNGGAGVQISLNAYLNTVRGNSIGLPGRPNANGVRLEGGAHDNQIGVTGSLYSNQINYNQAYGLRLSGNTTHDNQITNNAISHNGLDGVVFLAGTLSNTLGLLPTYNYISSNGRYGVQLAGGAHDNHVNYNHVASNVSHGILLTETNTADNVISNTLIYQNGSDGISQSSTAPDNRLTGVSIYHNADLPIDINADDAASNTLTPVYPVIQSAKRSGNQVALTGRTAPFLIGQAVAIEFYVPIGDPQSVGGGGQNYSLGQTYANLDGTFAVTLTTNFQCFTAVQTSFWLIGGGSSSSEFGPTSCRVNLPLVVR